MISYLSRGGFFFSRKERRRHLVFSSVTTEALDAVWTEGTYLRPAFQKQHLRQLFKKFRYAEAPRACTEGTRRAAIGDNWQKVVADSLGNWGNNTLGSL
jgi:hypothetical protein